MTHLGVPFEYMYVFTEEKAFENKLDNIARGKEVLEETITLYCVGLTALGAMTFVTVFVSYKMWNLLGTNLTIELRKDLYDAILEKDIGWFDFPDNGVSVITSAMA